MKNSTTKAMTSALLCGACLLAATSSWAATVNLRAERFTKTFTLPGGATTNVEMWGFALDAGAPTVPGPALTLAPGETELVVNLQNNLTVPISIVIPGQEGFVRDAAHTTFADAQGRTRARSLVKETPAGTTRQYVWTGFRPGTYLYHSGSQPALQVQMGLHGMLKQDAVDGRAYGVPYANETTWFFSEVDLDVHAAVRAGTYGTTVKSMIHSVPEIYLLNGEPYQVGELQLAANQTNLLRLLNACFDERILVLSGYHLTLLAEDGRQYPYPKVEAAVNLPALKTRDGVLASAQADTVKVFDRRILTEVNYVPPPDVTPPTLLSATALNGTTVQVVFSELMGASALVSGNYTINNGVAVTAAAPGPDDSTVFLTTTPLAGGSYILTVNAAADVAGNPVAPNSTASFSYTPPDLTPPTLVSATPVNGTTVQVIFSEPVGDSALLLGNYSLNNGVAITAAARGPDASTIILTTTTMSPANYVLTVNNVADVAGNLIAANSQATFSVYGIIFGSAASAVDLDGNNTASLTFAQGALVNGYIVVGISMWDSAPGASINQNGVFYDNVQMVRLGTRQSVNAGAEVYLYGLAVGAKPAGNYQVRMTGSEPIAEIIFGVASFSGVAQTGSAGPWAQNRGTAANNRTATVNVTSVAGDMVVDIFGHTFGTSVLGAGQIEIWSREDATDRNDGVSSRKPAIGTATALSHTLNSSQGEWAIGAVALKVGGPPAPDTTPPTIVSATATGPTSVAVLFSEAVALASAQTVANYAINNGVTISAAVLGADSRTVTLTTSTLLGSYVLTVNNVTDLALPPNAIAANSQAPFNWTWTLTGGAITINASGNGAPYPSTVTASGVSGAISKVVVALTGFTHTWPDDVDVLLVGPNNEKVLLMSDAGGGTAPAAPVTLTFDDAAASSLTTARLVSGTYRPTNLPAQQGDNGDTFPNTPGGAVGASLSVFNGTSPNGQWRLFVRDDSNNDGGSIAAWSVTIQLTSDTTAPTISSVTAVGPTSVQVLFSEPVAQASAQTVANYSINSGVNISAAVLGADTRTVTLTTSTLLAGNYTLTVNNVTDRAVPSNTIAANSSAPFTYTPPPVAVTFVGASSALDTDRNGTATLAFAQPALTAGYVVVGVSMWDATASTTIAGVTYGGTAMTPLGGISNPNSLTEVYLYGLAVGNRAAGNSAVVVTGSTGVDELVFGVTAFSGVNQAAPTGPFASAQATSAAATVNVATAAGDMVVDIMGYNRGTATVGAGQTQRWRQQDATDVEDGICSTEVATGASTTMSYTKSTSSEWTIGAVALKSAGFPLPDTTPPTIVSATATGPTSLEVLFSEAVALASAQTVANYSINSGVNISAAVLGADTRTVTLTTSTLLAGNYTLTVNNVTDRAVPSNTITANSSAPFTYTPPPVAVTFVGATSALDTDRNGTATLAFAQPALTAGYVVVGVSMWDATASTTIAGVTYGGTAMTRLGGISNPNALTEVYLYGLAVGNRAAGNSAVVVTGSTGVDELAFGVTAFSGVNQAAPTGPFASAQATSAAATVNVTTAAGDMVVDIMGYNLGTPTVGAGQTQRWRQQDTTEIEDGICSTELATGNSTTMSYTKSTSSEWTIGAIALKPAP